MTTTPMSTRPGEPEDPDLRDRYARDAWEKREAQRVEAGRAAAETPPSRTPSGPIKVVAALVTLVLVGGVGLALVGPMLRQTETSDAALPQGISELRLRNGIGDVRIREAEPGERPTAMSTVEWGLRKPTTSVDASGDRATVRGECPTGPVAVCATEWLIVVPEDTDVQIEQGVGEVTIEGMSGDVDVRGGVGGVELTEATSSTIGVDLGVGDVRIESVEPPRQVDASVGVGQVDLALPDTVGYRVQMKGGASETQNSVGNDPAAQRRVTLEAGVGDVTVKPS
ncbi:MAG: hypothetical protein ACTMHL_02110 [Janibacter sp.]